MRIFAALLTSAFLVQADSFTSVPLAKALLEAHRRGVQVQVILDESQRTENYSSTTFLLNEGIPCFTDAVHAIAHNKVMVIDAQTEIRNHEGDRVSSSEGDVFLRSEPLRKIFVSG